MTELREILKSGDVDGLVMGSGYKQLQGTATVWDDIAVQMLGRRLSSAQGTVDYDYDENAVAFSQNGDINDANDVIGANFQMPHKTKDGSDFRFHVHWEQTDNVERVFTYRYRVQSNGTGKTTAWVEGSTTLNALNNAFPYVSGTLNQITPLVAIPLAGVGLSSIVQVQLTRSDGLGGVILATSLDAHYEIDASGSAGEFTKWTES